ncbi:hypothetical protein MMC25_000582 [Agyrium rufum]|nr:hypothetical protein [Agyrium rufum]
MPKRSRKDSSSHSSVSSVGDGTIPQPPHLASTIATTKPTLSPTTDTKRIHLSTSPPFPFIHSTSHSASQPHHSPHLPSSTPISITSPSNPYPRAKPKIQCHLPPHSVLSFLTYEAYDVHYAHAHTNRCVECGRNFPSELFLELHLAECHDSFEEARRGRGEKTNYDFYIVNNGIDKRTSMLRSRHHQKRQNSAFSNPAQRSQQGQRQRSGSMISTPSTSTTGDISKDSSRRLSTTKEMPLTQVESNGGVSIGDEGSGSSSDEEEENDDEEHEADNGDEDEDEENDEEEEEDGKAGGVVTHAATTTAAPLPKKTNGDIDALSSKMSALKFVPSSIRFGRGGKKAGLARS